MQPNKILQIVFAVIGILFVIIVVVSLFPQANTSDDKNISGANSTCGGFANLKCPAGLNCVYPSGNATYPDQSGTCKPGASDETTFGLIKIFNRSINIIRDGADWVSLEIWKFQNRNPKDNFGNPPDYR